MPLALVELGGLAVPDPPRMSGATTRNPGRSERLDLQPPAVPELGEAVQQHDQGLPT
jgi:hypothetical protein